MKTLRTIAQQFPHPYLVATVITLFAACSKEQVAPVTFMPMAAEKPVADFVMGIDGDRAPVTVHFYNNSHNADHFYWDFGNGLTSGLRSPETVYAKAGTYTIVLAATKNDYTSTVRKTIIIGE